MVIDFFERHLAARWPFASYSHLNSIENVYNGRITQGISAPNEIILRSDICGHVQDIIFYKMNNIKKF